jgi:hypothetical protein
MMLMDCRADRMHNMNIELIDEISLLKLMNSRLAQSSNNVLQQQKQDADTLKHETRSLLGKQDDYIRQLTSERDRLSEELAKVTSQADNDHAYWLQLREGLMQEIDLLKQEKAAQARAQVKPASPAKEDGNTQTLPQPKALDQNLKFLCRLAEKISKINHQLHDDRGDDSLQAELSLSSKPSDLAAMLELQAFIIEEVTHIESSLSSMRERLQEQEHTMAKSFRAVEKSSRMLSKSEIKISALSLQLAEYDEMLTRLLVDLESIQCAKNESAQCNALDTSMSLSEPSASSFLILDSSAMNMKCGFDSTAERSKSMDRANKLMQQLKKDFIILANHEHEQAIQLRTANAVNESLERKLAISKAHTTARASDARKEELLLWFIKQMAALVQDLLLQKQLYRTYRDALFASYRDIRRLTSYCQEHAEAPGINLPKSETILSRAMNVRNHRSDNRRLSLRIVAIAVLSIHRMRARGKSINSTQLQRLLRHGAMSQLSSCYGKHQAEKLAAVCEILHIHDGNPTSPIPNLPSRATIVNEHTLTSFEHVLRQQLQRSREYQEHFFQQMTAIDALKVEVTMKTRIAEDWRDQVIALQQKIDMLEHREQLMVNGNSMTSPSSLIHHHSIKDRSMSYLEKSPTSYVALLSSPSQSQSQSAMNRSLESGSSPGMSSANTMIGTSRADLFSSTYEPSLSSPADHLSRHRSLNSTTAMNDTYHTAIDASCRVTRPSPAQSQQHDISMIPDISMDASNASNRRALLFQAHGSPERSDDFSKLFQEVNAATRWTSNRDARYQSSFIN